MTSKMRNEITKLESSNAELMEEIKVLQSIQTQAEQMEEFPPNYEDDLVGLGASGIDQPSIIENDYEEKSSDGS